MYTRTTAMHPASTDDTARVSSSEKLIGCSSHSSSLDLCSDVAVSHRVCKVATAQYVYSAKYC